MKLKSYREDLLARLRDPEYAAGFLAEALAEDHLDTFLLALREVIEAAGGIGKLAEHVNLQRQSLYKVLSEEGNPRLTTLQEILKALGLRVSITLDETA